MAQDLIEQARENLKRNYWVNSVKIAKYSNEFYRQNILPANLEFEKMPWDIYNKKATSEEVRNRYYSMIDRDEYNAYYLTPEEDYKKIAMKFDNVRAYFVNEFLNDSVLERITQDEKRAKERGIFFDKSDQYSERIQQIQKKILKATEFDPDKFPTTPRISWRRVRERVLERDKYSCQECSYQAVSYMEIHHLFPECWGGLNLPSTLQTLCFTCHKKH